MGEKRSLAVLAVLCEQVIGLHHAALLCQVGEVRRRACLDNGDAARVSAGLPRMSGELIF